MSNDNKNEATIPATYTFTSYEKNDVEVSLKVNNVSPIDSAKYKPHRIACLVFMVILNLALLCSAIALMVTAKTCISDDTLIMGKGKWWRTSVMSTFDFNNDYITFNNTNKGFNTIFVENYIKMNQMSAYLMNFKDKLSKLDTITMDIMNNVEIVINLGDLALADGITASYVFNSKGIDYIDFSNEAARKLLFDVLKNIMAYNVNSFAISKLPKKKDSNGDAVKYLSLLQSFNEDLKFATYKQSVNWIYIGDEQLTDEDTKTFILVSKKLSIGSETLTELVTKLNTHNQNILVSTLTDLTFSTTDKYGLSIFLPNALKFPSLNTLNILDVVESRSKTESIWRLNSWICSTENNMILSKLTEKNVVISIIIFNGGNTELPLATDTIANLDLSTFIDQFDNAAVVGKRLAPNKYLVAKLK